MNDIFFIIKIEKTIDKQYHCQFFFYLDNTDGFIDTNSIYLPELDYQLILGFAIIEQLNLVRKLHFSNDIENILSQIENISNFKMIFFIASKQGAINFLQSDKKYEMLLNQVTSSGKQFIVDRLEQIKDYPEMDHLIAFYAQALYNIDKELLRNIKSVDVTKYKYTRWVLEEIVKNERVSLNS